MKRIIASVLIICSFIICLCSCAKEKKNDNAVQSGETGEKWSMSIEDIENARPQWEALLYAVHMSDEKDDTNFRAYAYAYILTYYGFGTQTGEHSDKQAEKVSASREEMEILTKALFGKDAVFSGQDISGLFVEEGDSFVLKEPLEHIDAKYELSGINLSSKSIHARITTDKKESIKIVPESADKDFAYSLYLCIDNSES